MTVTATEVGALLDVEREQLVGLLAGLGDAGWHGPTLCAGWRVRELVAHLLMPYELSVPGFLGRLVAARFSFDVLADRVAGGTRARALICSPAFRPRGNGAGTCLGLRSRLRCPIW